jgi:hypothetical protein
MRLTWAKQLRTHLILKYFSPRWETGKRFLNSTRTKTCLRCFAHSKPEIAECIPLGHSGPSKLLRRIFGKWDPAREDAKCGRRLVLIA